MYSVGDYVRLIRDNDNIMDITVLNNFGIYFDEDYMVIESDESTRRDCMRVKARMGAINVNILRIERGKAPKPVIPDFGYDKPEDNAIATDFMFGKGYANV
jgi:hypothetical protein